VAATLNTFATQFPIGLPSIVNVEHHGTFLYLRYHEGNKPFSGEDAGSAGPGKDDEKSA
jgi:hypothetical protein